MKKNIYKVLFKSGNFDTADVIPKFKLLIPRTDKTDKSNKIINPFTFGGKQQHYYHECVIEIGTETEIIVDCTSKDKVLGTGRILFDEKRIEAKQQKVQLLDTKKKKVGTLEIVTKKIQKKPDHQVFKLELISGSFTFESENKSKIDPFLVVKIGDTHVKSKTDQGAGKQPKWNQVFDFKSVEQQTVFVESWYQQKKQYHFIGVTSIDIFESLNKKDNHPVLLNNKVKQGELLLRAFTKQTQPSSKPSQSAINDKNILPIRNLKVYVLEAYLKEDSRTKKDTYVKIQCANMKPMNTTSIYSQSKNPKWGSQSFQLKVQDQKTVKVALCEKDEKGVESYLGSCQVEIQKIQNKKSDYSLKNSKNIEIGTLYLEFEADWVQKQELPQPNLEPNLEEVHKQQMLEIAKSKSSLYKPANNSDQLNKRIMEMKNKYSGQSLHEYFNAQLNKVLQEGLLKIGRDKPADPIKELGLFLINYKRG